jgi:hypothetical protein
MPMSLQSNNQKMYIHKVFGVRVKEAQLYQWILDNPESELAKFTNNFFKNYEDSTLTDLLNYLPKRKTVQSDLHEIGVDFSDELYSSKFDNFSVYQLPDDVCENNEYDYIIGVEKNVTVFEKFSIDIHTGSIIGRLVENKDFQSQLERFYQSEIKDIVSLSMCQDYWILFN